jgi:hypothetical protein
MLGWRFDGIPPRLMGGPWARIFRRRWFRLHYHPSSEGMRDIAVKCRNKDALSRYWVRRDWAGRKQL